MTTPEWAINEIKAIQDGGIDWFGAPLKVDGQRGPKTDFWMGMLSIDPKRRAVISLLLGYHHQKMQEATGKNDGPFVDMILKPAKTRNVAWCIGLVSHAMTTCGVEYPKYHVSTWALIDWAKKEKLLVDEPLPGDIEAFLYPKEPAKDWSGHGRTVIAYDLKTKETYGVDGNSGDRVNVGKRRPRPDRYFIRCKGLSSEHKGLVFPSNTFYIDKLGDR